MKMIIPSRPMLICAPREGGGVVATAGAPCTASLLT
jgi:hypothetical protein